MRGIICAALLLLFSSAYQQVAFAQSHCPRCIEPSTARADSKLRVEYPTARAVWNPPPRSLAGGQERFHIQGSPSVVAYSGVQQPGFVFRAPNVKPGRYLVALYGDIDGTGPYAWDFVQLEAGLPDEAPTEGLPGWVIWVAIGAGVVIAVAATLALRSRRQPGA